MRSLFLVIAIVARVCAQYNYGVSRSFSVTPREVNLETTGAQSPDGSTGIRREIRELEKDFKTWDLYLLGLDLMQFMEQSQRESWYQIAGIHGRPYIPFDNVQATPGNNQAGYCTHTSVLFPTWHRPYLALYEQILFGLIRDIASWWPEGDDKDQYVAAAARFRIPYWDWANEPAPGKSPLPDSVQWETVVVVGPNGAQEISNPLYSYRFDPLDSSQLPDPPYNTYPQSLRYPSSSNAGAVSQNGLVAQQLNNSAASLRSRVYNLFTNYHDYGQFSNEAWLPNPNPNNFDSIESIHDAVHGLVGNGGHMSIVTYAAFDPIFMLHHTMVDRIFAIWQMLNPNSFITPTVSPTSTFTISGGGLVDGRTPLTPFHRGQDAFWTSDDIRNTQIFGYTYAETNTNSRDQVVAAVNTLYGTTTNQRRDLNMAGEHREWIANIRVKKYSLGVPFFIHIFLGPFDSTNPASWSFDPNLVASHTVFLKVENVTAADDRFITATIPLTSQLLDNISAGRLKNLDEPEVNEYLAKNFQYRLTLLDDTEIPNDQVPSLTISIVSAPVQLPSKLNELPIWGEMKSHVDISTSGVVSHS